MVNSRWGKTGHRGGWGFQTFFCWSLMFSFCVCDFVFVLLLCWRCWVLFCVLLVHGSFSGDHQLHPLGTRPGSFSGVEENLEWP